MWHYALAFSLLALFVGVLGIGFAVFGAAGIARISIPFSSVMFVISLLMNITRGRKSEI